MNLKYLHWPKIEFPVLLYFLKYRISVWHIGGRFLLISSQVKLTFRHEFIVMEMLCIMLLFSSGHVT